MDGGNTFYVRNAWIRDAVRAAGGGSANIFAYILFFPVLLLISRIWRWSKRRGEVGAKPSSPKAAERKPGEWTPVDFQRPAAQPYPNWSIEHTKPLPYRPFRYGPKYNVTMGIRPLSDWDEWLELDNQFPRFHAARSERIAARGSKVCRTAPEAFDAAVELLEDLCQYLPQRYPTLFGVIPVGIENLHTGERFDIISRPLVEDPMAMAARMTQDDFAIMLEKSDGQYYCLAGAVLIPGTWRLMDKFGMSLNQIHISGSVPLYESRLKKGMENFFSRLRPEAPYVRWNYTLQPDGELAWSTALGDEDALDESAPRSERFKDIDELPLEEYHFRSERQTLRRLPRTGAVVFTIRVYLHPISEVVGEPYVPGRLASAIRSWDGEVAEYKKKKRYTGRLLQYLDEKHDEQVAAGLDPEKEDEVRTYPY